MKLPKLQSTTLENSCGQGVVLPWERHRRMSRRILVSDLLEENSFVCLRVLLRKGKDSV